MPLTLFHEQSRRVFLAERGLASSFGHTFGGPAVYSGTTAYPDQPPVHMFFRLRLDDPAVGVSLPGIQWLPLLCAIRYGACEVGYRVLSDEKVKILHQTEAKAWKGFPYNDYPERLAAEPLAFKEVPYEPANPKHALRYAAVFGYDALTSKQYADLARHVVDVGLFVPGILDWKTPEEFLEGNGWPFVQGRPTWDCPETACTNHGRKASLRTLAIFQEEEGRRRALWGRSCDNLQIIYQICPACEAIRTCNQCT